LSSLDLIGSPAKDIEKTVGEKKQLLLKQVRRQNHETI
jgi:hypothetical protein